MDMIFHMYLAMQNCRQSLISTPINIVRVGQAIMRRHLTKRVSDANERHYLIPPGMTAFFPSQSNSRTTTNSIYRLHVA